MNRRLVLAGALLLAAGAWCAWPYVQEQGTRYWVDGLIARQEKQS